MNTTLESRQATPRRAPAVVRSYPPSYTLSGDVPIKHASFGCFSDVCGGSHGSATSVFVIGEEMTPSERRSRVEKGKNVEFCEFEDNKNGDLVRDENGDAVKAYHHRFPGPQSPANVADLINDTYPVGEYVLQRTNTKETTITLPASTSGTDADRLAARYAVEGETEDAFDVQVFGEHDRPQVVVRPVSIESSDFPFGYPPPRPEFLSTTPHRFRRFRIVLPNVRSEVRSNVR